MLDVPRLDLESVDEATAEVADNSGVSVGAQVAVPLEAVEQHRESFAEVAGAEVREARLRDGLSEQLVGRGVARHGLSRPLRGRDRSGQPSGGTRHASRPGRVR